MTRIAVNPYKLYLAVKWEILLEHIISKAAEEHDLEKVKVTANLKTPNDVKEIQSIVGHIHWYRDRM